jgi:predicted methyltransferase
MERGAIKEFMYGGVAELMRNRKYFYHSSVGSSYCHWTEDGQKALAEFMIIIGQEMVEAEETEIRDKAKAMTLRAVKGESK